MAAEAATFALASVAHFATGFTDAAIPELLIAAVLGLGSFTVLSRHPRAWGAATGTTGFATFGTIVGLTIIAAGRQDAPDLAYHTTILTALAATLIALWRQRDAARRPPRGRDRRPGSDKRMGSRRSPAGTSGSYRWESGERGRRPGQQGADRRR
jgi:hypothetical protein